METFKLNNGLECPVIGLGTYTMNSEQAEAAVKSAIDAGCRLIDTANEYLNERSVGRGIKASGAKREDIFLCTKLWGSEYENENAVDETLERLGVDYVDLLFIHNPAGNWRAGYRQLEKAYRAGKAKTIGISNFEGKFLADMVDFWEIAPQFAQMEIHPYYAQDEVRKTLDKYDIRPMAWYPLGHGEKNLVNEPAITALAEKYGKSNVQIILKWHTQMGFVPIPGSKNADHIKDNLNIFDFKLTDDDMASLAKLNQGKRFFNYYALDDKRLTDFPTWKLEYEKA